MASVLTLLNAAVVAAWQEHQLLHDRWIKLSVHMSGGDPFIMNDVQQVGHLDLLLRSAELEMAAVWERGDLVEMGTLSPWARH